MYNNLVCFLVTAVGLALLAYSFPIFRSAQKLLRQATPVVVKVTDGRIEEDVEGNRISQAVFEIVGGPHDGLVRESQMGSWPPSHVVGEIGPGLFDTNSGRLERASSVRKLRLFSIVLALVGMALIGTAPRLYLDG